MSPYRSPLPEATPKRKRRLSRRTRELLQSLAAVAWVTAWSLLFFTARRLTRDGWIIPLAFAALYVVIFVARFLFAQRLAAWRAARTERLADEWLAKVDARKTQ